MKRTWKRALATLLTIAMMATLLVVPAAADETNPPADGKYVLDFSEDSTWTAAALDSETAGGTNSYFAVGKGTIATVATGDGVFTEEKWGGDAYTAAQYWYSSGGNISTKSAERNIHFTTQNADAVVKIWWQGKTAGGSNKNAPSIGVNGATEANKFSFTAKYSGTDLAASGDLQVATYTLGDAGTYYIAGSSNWKCVAIYRIEVTDKEADPNALSIKMDETAIALVGKTVTLTPTVTPEGAEVTWSSSDSEVATVEDGVVTGIGAGKATITASVTKDGETLTATCEVTVMEDLDGILHVFSDNGTVSGWMADDGVKVYTGMTANPYMGEVSTGTTTTNTTTFKGVAVTQGIKFDSGGYILFTAPKAGTVTVYFAKDKGGTALSTSNTVGCAEGDKNATIATGEAIGDDYAWSFTAKAGVQYKIARKSGESAVVALVWTASDWATKHTTHDFTIKATEGDTKYNYCSTPVCMEKEEAGEEPPEPATREVTFAGDNATVSEVTQGETTLTADSGVYTANQTDDITFKVTAEEGYAITEVKQGGTTLTATGDVYTIPAGTEDAAITITATQLKTGTPAFSETEVQLQSKTDTKVALTLTSSLPEGTIYRLHPTATSEETMGTAGGVTASGGKITFNLKTVPTADVTYYVKAYEGNKAASEAAPITIKAYVPVDSVSLVHVGAQGEEHTLVGHVIYEKLNDSDPDVIGGAGNLDPSYPNGWKLVAKVLPAGATNTEVVFTNLKEADDCIHVDGDGMVTAIKAGTGTLQVASVAESDVTADFEITVKVRIGSVEIQKDGADAGASQSVAVGETLALTANVTTSASGESEHKTVTWTSSDSDVATVSGTGRVTPKKAGTATITATSTRDNTVKDTVEVTVTKGTPALTITPANASVASGDTVTLKVNGAKGMTPTLAFQVGGEDKTADFTVPGGVDDGSGNFTFTDITVPANDTGAVVTYTVTASVAGDDAWSAATTATAGTVRVQPAGAKVITVTAPAGSHGTATATVGQSEDVTLSVTANVDGGDGSETLAYAWSKGDDVIAGATAATYTIPTADLAAAGTLSYKCVVSVDGDATVDTAEVVFDVTVSDPALASIDVELTAAQGVSYTDGALAIVGPVDAVLTIQTAPAGHGDTVAFDVDDDTVVNVDIDGDTLTVSPKKPGTAAVTLKGTEAESVTKVIAVTVTKAPAPTPLTKDDITVTQPTAEGGKGTIAIKSPVVGTEYRYKTTAESGWHDMTGASVEVDPGTYLVRIKVDNPTLQNYNPGVSVEVKAFAAAPTVSAVAITGGSSVKVEGTLQLTAQVTMSDSTVSDTETVTWTSSDSTKATVSDTGLVTGVAEGTVTITATSTTDSAKKAEKTITVAPKGTTPTVDKAALNSAVTAAETALEAAVESVDGTDVPTTGTWITAADKATLEAAITDAKTVAAKADATQAEVSAAKTAVENAAKAIKAGTKDEGGESADKTALTAAITAAETAATAVKVSTNGSDVATTAKWVTQADKDAYTAAIADAKAVAEKADASEEDVAKALADLAEATTAFETAQKAGTKTGGTTHRPSSGSSAAPVVGTSTTAPDGTKVTVSTKDGVTTAVVTVPGGVDKTTVTIPVTEPDSGLVPVIVNADGTEEIVRMSVVTDEGMALTLDKSATVMLVNNAKEFVDVPGHWAEKSVDFATARELFNGTDATHFTPNGAMTRGMMATVLFRLDGENKGEAAAHFTDVADTWYTDAVAWAAESGVVNGYGNGSFLPEKSINREELAVMVYRYAKALGLGYAAGAEVPDLTYKDADGVSEWAYEAISWLTAKGVLNGKPGNVIDAGGLATRAEVSTVLERFMKVAK